MKFLLFAVVLTALAYNTKGHRHSPKRAPIDDSFKNMCILKGKCGEGGFTAAVIPCHEEHDPYYLDDIEALAVLNYTCPELMDGTEHPLLCCDANQIFKLEDSFELPATLGLSRCPSCLHNFRINFCQSTCSPRQADFISVQKSSQTDDNRKKVDEVEYLMNINYAQGLYQSCKGVQGPAAGQTVLDFMCGTDDCSPEKWLTFMGMSEVSGGYAPYQINFLLHNETEVKHANKTMFPMSLKTVSCSDSPGDEMSPCSCTDCEKACEKIVIPTDDSSSVGYESSTSPSTESYHYRVYVYISKSHKQPVKGELSVTFFTTSGITEIPLSQGSESVRAGSILHYSVQLLVKVQELRRISFNFKAVGGSSDDKARISKVTLVPAYEGGISDRRQDLRCAEIDSKVGVSDNRSHRLKKGNSC